MNDFQSFSIRDGLCEIAFFVADSHIQQKSLFFIICISFYFSTFAMLMENFVTYLLSHEF